MTQSIENIRAYFTESNTSLVETVPATEVNLIVEANNSSTRQRNIEATINCPALPEINGTVIKFQAPGMETGRGSLKIKTPANFDTIPITIEAIQTSGLLGYGKAAPIQLNVTIRKVVQSLMAVSGTPETQKILDEMAKSGEKIILVPDVTKDPDVNSIVGDISSNPTVAISLETTTKVPISIICDDRVLLSLQTTTEKARRLLQQVSEDQHTLRYFQEIFRKYLVGTGATVEGPDEDLHIKVGPNPLYMYYTTQVSPNVDPAIINKIDKLATRAKKENAQATMIVKQLDPTLADISAKYQMNVVDVFHGIQLKGTWYGDQMLTRFLAELKLPPVVEIKDTKAFAGAKTVTGAYTQADFLEALNLAPMTPPKGDQSTIQRRKV